MKLHSIFTLTVALVVLFALGAWLWPYTLNAWLVYFDKSPAVEWYHGVLLTLIPFPVVFHVMWVAALLTYVSMLFLV